MAGSPGATARAAGPSRLAMPSGRAGAKPRHRLLILMAFAGPLMAYLILLYIYPLTRGLTMSFQDFDVAALLKGSGRWIGLDNYRVELAHSVTRAAFWRTAVFTAASVICSITIGLAVALYFNRKFVLSKVLRGLLLLPWLLPAMASGTIFRIMFSENGLVNTLLVGVGLVDQPRSWLTSPSRALIAVILVNIWAGIPFPAVTFFSGLQDIPPQLYEAASLDGAGPWTRLRRITVPMLRPVTMIVLVYGIIYTVKVFDIVWVMTSGGPADGTQLMSTWAYTESFTNYAFGRGAAVSNLLLVFSIAVGIIYIRMIRRSER